MEKLLSLLRKDARLSNKQLATMLNIQEEEVAKQISVLENQGIIRGYTALIDENRINEEHVTAYIEVKVTPKPDFGFDSIAETIMGYEEVESVLLMSGRYDLAVTITGKTLQNVAMFVSDKLSTLDGVVGTTTHFVLQRYKDKGITFLKKVEDERGLVSP